MSVKECNLKKEEILRLFLGPI